MRTGELKGRWWLPATPHVSVPGTLVIAQHEPARVVVAGQIVADLGEEDALVSVFGRERRIGVVHGHTTTGLDVTLSDVRLQVDEMEFGRPDLATFELVGASAFVGRHIDPDSVTFSRLCLEMQQLAAWRGERIFTQRATPSWSKADEVTISGRLPDRVRAPIPGGSITLVSSISASAPAIEASLRLASHLQIDLAREITIGDWFRRYVGPLARLMSLAAGRTLGVEKVTVGREGGCEIEVTYPHEVDDSLSQKALGPADFLFWLPDLDPSPGLAFASWLAA